MILDLESQAWPRHERLMALQTCLEASFIGRIAHTAVLAVVAFGEEDNTIDFAAVSFSSKVKTIMLRPFARHCRP